MEIAIGEVYQILLLNLHQFVGIFKADWVFVAQEFAVSVNLSNSFGDRVDAQILGIGLGLAATPKTIYQLIVDPYAIPFWYGISNVGVTNTPSSK